jgi:hypothetical protein
VCLRPDGDVMTRHCVFLLIILGSLSPPAYAKRLAPPEVPPITFSKITYSAPHWGRGEGKEQNGGYIEATDATTGKFLWELRIYTVEYDLGLEQDVQDVFIRSMKIADGTLRILSENGDTFVVDLSNRRVTVGAGRVYRTNIRTEGAEIIALASVLYSILPLAAFSLPLIVLVVSVWKLCVSPGRVFGRAP